MLLQMFANKKDVRFGEILDEWKAAYNYEIDYDALKIDAPEDTSKTADTAE